MAKKTAIAAPDPDDVLPEYRFEYGKGVGQSPEKPFKPKRFEDIQTGWNLITPQIASEGVRRTQHKHKMVRSKRHVDMLVKDILEDNWHANGQTIVLSVTGMVNDGTHRFFACSVSNKPLVSYFVVGVPDDLMATYGDAKPLPPGDQLSAYENQPNAAILAATARIVLSYKNGLMTQVGQNKFTRTQIVDCALLISDTVQKYHTTGRSPMFLGKISPSWVTALIVIADTIDERMAEVISEQLRTRSLYPGTVLHNFAARLDSLTSNPRQPEMVLRFAMMLNAFNDFKAGIDKRVVVPKQGTITAKTFPVLWGVQPEDLPF